MTVRRGIWRWAGLLLGSAGCSSGQHAGPPDPLERGQYAPGSATTATLAGGSGTRLPDSSGNRTLPPPPTAGSPNGISLQQPVASSDGARTGQLTSGNPPPPVRADSPAPPGSGESRATGFEQAQALLTARGVKWQRLETFGDGEWTFLCSVPSKTNPQSARRYEAHDRTPLGAMQAVLDQIQKDQR
jgi:hypothetical protein